MDALSVLPFRNTPRIFHKAGCVVTIILKGYRYAMHLATVYALQGSSACFQKATLVAAGCMHAVLPTQTLL
jgi:hypothetical protein